MFKTFLLRPRARKIIIKDLLLGQGWTHSFYKYWRKQRLKSDGHVDWQTILRNSQAFPQKTTGQKVLIATSTGAHLTASCMEQTLGAALTLRNAQVSFLLCDAALPACLMCEYTFMRSVSSFVKDGPKSLICETCYQPAEAALRALNLPIHRYGQYLTAADYRDLEIVSESVDLQQIASYSHAEIQVGEQAFAGACRFFGTGDPLRIKGGEQVLRRYLFAALLAARSIENLFLQNKPEVVVLHHGIYVPQGLIVQLARKYKVRVVTWHTAYRKGCFIFSHSDTYHRTMMEEPRSEWRDFAWDKLKQEKILKYLESRHTGKQDWIWFHEKPKFDRSQILAQLALDHSKPIIGLLTNVIWDAQLHYPNNAFANMMQWINASVDFFITRPHIQLVIRVHPAEIYGSVLSRQTVEDELRRRYQHLPANIKVISPSSSVSTYALMQLCDSVLIHSTKTGIELAALGQPVIVAGEAWIRNKGFAIDANSPEHYQEILGRLPLKKTLTPEQIEDAQRFAYHFFFRRMIPVSIFSAKSGWSQIALNIKSLSALAPSSCAGLDTICNGILHSSSFAFENAINDGEALKKACP